MLEKQGAFDANVFTYASKAKETRNLITRSRVFLKNTQVML